MAFVRHTGRTKLISVPVTTSTVMTTQGIVAYSSNLLIQAAISATAAPALCGILRKSIASTDSDYATARSVLVEVPLDKNVEWTADTTGTTFAAGDEVDISDAFTINRAAQAVKVAQIRLVLSATQSIVVLKLGGSY